MHTDTKIDVHSLSLELTRRCNIACCDHCLCGESEDLDIDRRTIRNALRGIKSIRDLNFTGGEPSMVPELMEYALEYCESHSIPVYSVYIITNGKRVTDQFLDICDEWHFYCMSHSYPMQRRVENRTLEEITRQICNTNEPQGISIALSADQFHEPIPVENLIRLTSRSYFRRDKYNTELFAKSKCILPAGKALELLPQSMLQDIRVISESLDLGLEDGSRVSADELCINAKGDILPDCGLSYREQETRAIANVNDPDWIETLAQIAKKQNS